MVAVAIRLPDEPFGFDWIRVHQFSQLSSGPGVALGLVINPGNISGDVGYLQTGAYIEHVATGLWLYGAMVGSSCPICPARSPMRAGFLTNGGVLNSEPDHWYVKGGLRERWTTMGHSVFYGFYGQRNDMIGAGCGR